MYNQILFGKICHLERNATYFNILSVKCQGAAFLSIWNILIYHNEVKHCHSMPNIILIYRREMLSATIINLNFKFCINEQLFFATSILLKGKACALGTPNIFGCWVLYHITNFFQFLSVSVILGIILLLCFLCGNNPHYSL